MYHVSETKTTDNYVHDFIRGPTARELNRYGLLPNALGYVIWTSLTNADLGRLASTSRTQRDHPANEYEWRRRLRASTDATKANPSKITTVMRKLRTVASARRKIRAGGHTAPAWLLRSRTFVEESVRVNPRLLAYKAWSKWLSDRHIVLVGLRNGGHHFGRDFDDDEEVVRAYIDGSPHYRDGLSVMGDTLKTNRPLVEYAIRHGARIMWLSDAHKDDKALALLAMSNCHYNYRALSDRLTSDPDVLRLFLPHVTLREAVGHFWNAPDDLLKTMLLSA